MLHTYKLSVDLGSLLVVLNVHCFLQQTQQVGFSGVNGAICIGPIATLLIMSFMICQSTTKIGDSVSLSYGGKERGWVRFLCVLDWIFSTDEKELCIYASSILRPIKPYQGIFRKSGMQACYTGKIK